MDKNNAEYGLQMFIDSLELSDEEFTEKYPECSDQYEWTDPVHGRIVGWTAGDAYHRECPIHEDGWIDYAWGYMGD